MVAVRVAIVSDLHAYAGKVSADRRPSHLGTDLPRSDVYLHPMTALRSMVDRDGLRADVLLCAGDLGNLGNPEAMSYAWREVDDLASALEVVTTIATAGNHDAARSSTTDIWESLKGLLPLFPTPDVASNNAYWANAFAGQQSGNWTVITLNSSFHHALGPKAQDRGKVSEATTNALRAYLASLPRTPVQILLAHHHPYPYGSIDVGDLSDMDGGGYLVETLGSGDYGAWTIVHGHRHYPHLAYALGDNNAPVMFSAGSLTSGLYLALQTRARNQFYLLEFDPEAALRLGVPIAATFSAWDWVSAAGWQPARAGSGLPGRGGFGVRGLDTALVAEVAAFVRRSKRGFIDWDQLVQRFEHLAYLMPTDVDRLATTLRASQGLRVHCETGSIWQVARP